MIPIGGLQKTTTLDFPGHVSALVFTQGCNFTCPYCYNTDLVGAPQGDGEKADAVLGFLDSRRRLLEGVVISGGEPTLHAGLPEFCGRVKSMGYKVKLDTNGSAPQMLSLLLEGKLLDYVALDIKTDPARYPASISPKPPGSAIMECIGLLESGGVEHEYRTTCVEPFVTPEILGRMGEALKGTNAPWFLQAARLDTVLSPRFFRAMEQGGVPTAAGMRELEREGRRFVAGCAIRS